MKRLSCIALGFMLLVLTGCGLKPEDEGPEGSVTWRINTLENIGESSTSVIGNPRVINPSGGMAVLFDGENDGLIVNNNPISGAKVFTIEAIFRPDPGGPDEQRWLHIQEDTGDNRALLEIRLIGEEWALDTFIKSDENELTLYSGDFLHPLGRWHHVALIYDGALMRHYVDGKEELSGPLRIEPLVNGRTSIGMRLNYVSWFKGAVRKARFTPRALRPEEFMKQ
ncbi:MAG: LamG-like jellyroll fold domain-containing protein [Candidatus Latescibacterota bacterium]